MANKHPLITLRRQATLVGLALVATLAATTPALADDRPDGAELATAGAMMIVIVIFFIAAGLAVWWSWQNGELEEPEEIKYQMLAMVEDEEDFWGLGTHDRDDEEDDAVETPRGFLPRPSAG